MGLTCGEINVVFKLRELESRVKVVQIFSHGLALSIGKEEVAHLHANSRQVGWDKMQVWHIEINRLHLRKPEDNRN